MTGGRSVLRIEGSSTPTSRQEPPMSEKPISPPRQRMLDDMNMRRFVPDTQREYIVVFRAEASAAGMPMTHNLAVKVVSSASGVERNTLATLVKKGALLPKSGAEHFRASRDLRSGDGSYLEFEVYEQIEEVEDPSLNLPVGCFRLSSDNLEKGDIIRRGDAVIIHWSIDENGLLNSNLEFPEISQTYNTGKMYAS